MNQGFQISEEDIENVLFSNQEYLLYSEDTDLRQLADELFSILDFQQIEDAAMYGDTLDEQTSYAVDEIKRQLIELKVLSFD